MRARAGFNDHAPDGCIDNLDTFDLASREWEHVALRAAQCPRGGGRSDCWRCPIAITLRQVNTVRFIVLVLDSVIVLTTIRVHLEHVYEPVLWCQLLV